MRRTDFFRPAIADHKSRPPLGQKRPTVLQEGQSKEMLRGEIGGDSLNLPLSSAGMSYFSNAALFRF
jgi:hypothetical protein